MCDVHSVVPTKKKENGNRELPLPEANTVSVQPTQQISTLVKREEVVVNKSESVKESVETDTTPPQEIHPSIRNVNVRGRVGSFKTESVFSGIPSSLQRPVYKQIVWVMGMALRVAKPHIPRVPDEYH